MDNAPKGPGRGEEAVPIPLLDPRSGWRGTKTVPPMTVS